MVGGFLIPNPILHFPTASIIHPLFKSSPRSFFTLGLFLRVSLNLGQNSEKIFESHKSRPRPRVANDVTKHLLSLGNK